MPENFKDTFIKKLDVIYPLISDEDLVKYSRMFRNELTAALSNQRSSLPTILNPIHKLKPKSGFGVAVSIGGTNGYVSAFRVDRKGSVKFLNRRMFVLPPETTKDKLFHLITQNILQVTNGRKKAFPIGVGFAYPLKPVLHHGFIDGELMYMTKGRNIDGLVGKLVGREYHKFLIDHYRIDTRIAVANDAICLLLGGSGAGIAGVVGTGLNFAYWEKRTAIAPLKLSQLHGFGKGEVAVNIESKNFNKIAGTKLRDKIDKTSDDPGYSWAEKETAGAYLYKIFNAGKDELPGNNFPALVSTDQLNGIITGAYKYPKGISEDAEKQAVLFAERIFQRSAQIVAVELCGVIQKLGTIKGMVPAVMEGGLFWKGANYSTLVNYYIHLILPGVTVSFARIFGSSRLGIAILACGE